MIMEQTLLLNVGIEGLKAIISETVTKAVSDIVSAPEEYLTRQELATRFNVCLATVHNWANKGLLKPHKVGGRVLYKLSEVTASLEEVKYLRYNKDRKGGRK